MQILQMYIGIFCPCFKCRCYCIYDYHQLKLFFCLNLFDLRTIDGSLFLVYLGCSRIRKTMRKSIISPNVKNDDKPITLQ